MISSHVPTRTPARTPSRTRVLGLTLGGLALIVAAMLTFCAGTTYAGAAGHGVEERTQTTTKTATTATAGVARVYEFGPVTGEAGASCKVTIDWGDKTSAEATLGEPNSSGERQVTATHVYAMPGSYEAVPTATPSESSKHCWLGTHTTEPIMSGDVTDGYKTTYTATIFTVGVSEPTPSPTTPESTSSTSSSSSTSSTSPASTPSTATVASSSQPTAHTSQTPLIEPPASLCGRSSLFDLIDIYPQAGRVHLVGYADPRLAGQTVRIVSTWNHRVTATTTVAANGYFHATAPLPPKRVQGTNKARYEAQDGSYRSSALKLTRRMYLYTLTPASSGMVKITGIVLPPLTRPVSTISVYRRDNCAQPGYAHVRATVSLNRRTGRFTVLAPAAPEGATGAVYRLSTTVRGTTGAGADQTFTLPRTLVGQ